MLTSLITWDGSAALRPFVSDWREAAVGFTIYQRGKPQPRALRGECGGGKAPPQISRRKDQAGRLGIEEKVSKQYTTE